MSQTKHFKSRVEFSSALANCAALSADRIRDQARFTADWIDTPIGSLIAIADESGVNILEFPERRALPTEVKALLGLQEMIQIGASPMIDRAAHALALYFDGQDPGLDIALAPKGSAFEHRHWTALRAIPPGSTRTYGAMADQLDTAPRALGRANGANPIAIAIPCHRLVAKDGALTGYGGGLWRKRWLLDFEMKTYG